MKEKHHEAIAFLKQIKKIDIIIENKLTEREQWKQLAVASTSRMDTEKVQTTANPKKMEDAVVRYVNLDAEIDRYIDELIAAKKEVLSVIEQLDSIEYDILHKIFVQYMSLYDIAELYEKTYSWATTTQNRALKNVEKILLLQDSN